MVIYTVPPWVLTKTKIYSTICQENSSNSAIFGTFGPFFDIFGPFWPIFGLHMPGWLLFLDKLSVFWGDITISIDYLLLYHFQVPKIAKNWLIFRTFGPFFCYLWSICANFWPPRDWMMAYFGWIACIMMRTNDFNRFFLSIFHLKVKKFATTLKKSLILRFVSNFKGVGKIMLLCCLRYFREPG